MSKYIKTPAEISAMRIGGKILGEVLSATCKMAKPGISTYELDQFAENFIRSKGATPAFKGFHGFPATLCTAINEVIVHGIPRKDEILKNGDLLTIDCGVTYKNLCTDAARSIIVGDKEEPEKKRMIEVATKALEEATKILKDGTPVNQIGKIIEAIVQSAGYKIIKELTGHGLGHSLHEPPCITNHFDPSEKSILKEGMTIAIEPIFSISSEKMITKSDNWTLVTSDNSLAVQVENTILITKTGHEVLTASFS